jgi:hypothetical protein
MNEFDKAILNALYQNGIVSVGGSVPKTKGEYDLPEGDYGTIRIHPEDREIFSILFPIKGGTKAGNENSAGTGNAEIAVYWLFKYNRKDTFARNTQGGSNPDLRIGNNGTDGFGAEIKSYKSSGKIKIGKFSEDKSSIRKINHILSHIGLDTRTNIKGNLISPSNNSFDINDLKEAGIAAIKYYTHKYYLLRNISRSNDRLITQLQYVRDSAVIGIIKEEIDTNEKLIAFHRDKIDKFNETFSVIDIKVEDLVVLQYQNGKPIDVEELEKKHEEIVNDLTLKIIKKLLINKLKLKPGHSGYIFNIPSKSDDIDFIRVDLNKLEQLSKNSNFHKLIKVNCGEISIQLKEIFTFPD